MSTPPCSPYISHQNRLENHLSNMTGTYMPDGHEGFTRAASDHSHRADAAAQRAASRMLEVAKHRGAGEQQPTVKAGLALARAASACSQGIAYMWHIIHRYSIHRYSMSLQLSGIIFAQEMRWARNPRRRNACKRQKLLPRFLSGRLVIFARAAWRPLQRLCCRVFVCAQAFSSGAAEWCNM